MVQLVGILNVTPDSFSDGGKFLDPAAALSQAEQLFSDGASLIDIGAESTRPNATPLSHEEEWQRLQPVLTKAVHRWPGKISLDTYHPETVRSAYEMGPVIVNDVTGMHDPEMIDAVVTLRATCVVGHLPGGSIQGAHAADPIDDLQVVKQDLLKTVELLIDRGIRQDHIILDPGIGFGKTAELNWRLLEFASEVPEYKVMIGYSRKRFLGDNRMEVGVNLQAGKIAIEAGAAYLRVHDVKAHHALLH